MSIRWWKSCKIWCK